MNQKPQLYIAGMGMESPCGHIDFYPNGGYDQPGCSLFDMPVSLDSMVDPDSSSTAAIDTMGRHLVACSHNRGIELYIESLQEESKCHFIGHECESDEKFQDGLCFDCGLRHSALKSELKVKFYREIVILFKPQRLKSSYIKKKNSNGSEAMQATTSTLLSF